MLTSYLLSLVQVLLHNRKNSSTSVKSDFATSRQKKSPARESRRMATVVQHQLYQKLF